MQEPWRERLVGTSAAMEHVADVIRLVAPRRTTVLITGETGTGKEVVARAIHAAGPRAAAPFIAINCSALPANLLEAELFGHVKGAFTGAVANRAGRFELAHRGTIFLDEIGEMPLDLQAKLLRVLQERELERLGSRETVRIDVRVIAATNADLPARVRRGEFREDLFYRLNVVPLALPPLRDRISDIPALADHFLDRICAAEGIPAKTLTPSAYRWLESYSWPGNVRQLENAIEMAVALSGTRNELSPADFPLPENLPAATADLPALMVALPDQGLDFERTLSAIAVSLLQQALERTRGNKQKAADILNLNRTTLSAKLKTLAVTA